MVLTRPNSAATMRTMTITDPFNTMMMTSSSVQDSQQQQQQQQQQRRRLGQRQRQRRNKRRVSPFNPRREKTSPVSRTQQRPGTASSDPGLSPKQAARGPRVHMLDFSPTATATRAEDEGAWRGRAANRFPPNTDISLRTGIQTASRQQQPALVPTYYSTPDVGSVHMDAEVRAKPVIRATQLSSSKLSVRQPTLEIEPVVSVSRHKRLPGRVYRPPNKAKTQSRPSTAGRRPRSAEQVSTGVRPQSAGVVLTQLDLDIEEPQEATAQSSLSDWVGSTVRIPYGLHSPAMGAIPCGAQISFSEGNDLAVRLPPDGRISEWTMEMDREGGRDLPAESYAESSTATVGLSDTVQEQFNLMVHSDMLQRARLVDSPVSVQAVQPAVQHVADLTFAGAKSPPADIGVWQVDRQPTTPGATSIENSLKEPSVAQAVAQVHCSPTTYPDAERTAWSPAPQQRRPQPKQDYEAYPLRANVPPHAPEKSLERPLEHSRPLAGWLPSETRQAVGMMRMRTHPMTPPVQRVGAR